MDVHVRPPRRQPQLPDGEIELEPPPVLPEPEASGTVLTQAIPILGSLGSIGLMATMSGPASEGQARGLVAAGVFLVSTVTVVVVQLDRQRQRRLRSVERARAAYHRYLAGVRKTLRDAAGRQRAELRRQFPEPSALPALAEEGSRLWERGPDHPLFLQVRYGVCVGPLSVTLVVPDRPAGDRVDPAGAVALRRLVEVHRVQPALPATVDLRALDRVEISGRDDEARSLARAMICSAAASHSPDHLTVAVLTSKESRHEWEWVKWLPHAWSAADHDAVGPRRLASSDAVELAALLEAHLSARRAPPHVIVVVDRRALPERRTPGGTAGVTTLHLPPAEDDSVSGAGLRLVFEEGADLADRAALRVLRPDEAAAERVDADQCDLPTAEAVARRLTSMERRRLVAKDDAPRTGAGSSVDLMDLLGLDDVHDHDPASVWGDRPGEGRLRVPIGVNDAGETVHLDLEEASRHGMGPHGVLVGATGSGKSELLRTLVLGLALNLPPERLNMVLVDFKGGATFAGMASMPHVSAVITNLAEDLSMVDRMQDALTGEMIRRQEVLRAGGQASVHDHERARAAGAGLPALPSLFIVVDEFSELLAAKPEFVDLFAAIGRLGRSLGLHLLLASQRLDEGRLRGLESHLSYRIGLRTFSAQESRAVLGVPDAYELPPQPGLGLLRADPTTLVRFAAAYVSGPPRNGRARRAMSDAATRPVAVLPWTVPVVHAAEAPRPRPPDARQESTLDLAVRRMSGRRPRAHQVWLPPLDRPDTLDALMPDLAVDPALGLVSHGWRERGPLTIPLGTVDRPREQRRDTLTADLSGALGHCAVVGAPRTGKSTLLRTLVTAVALTTTPLESQFFVLDLGGTFAGLRALPHVAGAAGRAEPDVVRRIVAEATGVVDRRESYFERHGIDAMETYRSLRAEGRADDGYGDVFVVVDGWGALRVDFDGVEVELQHLAARGLGHGLHLVASTTRWADFRSPTRDLFGTRLELRLGDPLDSGVDRRTAAQVPSGRPGRGLLADGQHFLSALPRIDAGADPATLTAGVEALVGAVADAWPGPLPPKLRMLPELVAGAEVVAGAGPEAAARRLLLGVDEKALAPVWVDPADEPHLLVFGDRQSGKTAALRGYLHEVMRIRTPGQAQLVVVDYRRSLLGEVPEEYLLHYLTSGAQAAPALAGLASFLESRLPGDDVTPEQLRHRSWWSGAEAFVVVDDYDLVATSTGSPLQPLVPLLAQARDVGLHVAVARRAGGASRALYEPVIQTLRDLAMPGVVLSGSPDEGPLIGNVRPGPAPPGRGRLVTRDREGDVVQLAWRAPAPDT